MCFGTSMAQIQITPFIDEHNCCTMPNGICAILNQKLSTVISHNGVQSQMGESRFILTCNVTEESKNVLSTSPTQIAYVLNLHMFIGDGETGTKYISESFRLKGVGTTEEKAYRNAIKNLDASSDKMASFVSRGNKRIIDYYENNKNQILSSISSNVLGKNLELAAYELCLIPQECSYYNEVMNLLGQVNSQIVDNNSSSQLLYAKSIWAAEQNELSANKVSEIISNIAPTASCFSEANEFMTSVIERMEQLNNREWVAYQKQLAHKRKMDSIREKNRSDEAQMLIMAQRDQNLARIQAVRDIAVQYAKNRPRVVYCINGWY